MAQVNGSLATCDATGMMTANFSGMDITNAAPAVWATVQSGQPGQASPKGIIRASLKDAGGATLLSNTVPLVQGLPIVLFAWSAAGESTAARVEIEIAGSMGIGLIVAIGPYNQNFQGVYAQLSGNGSCSIACPVTGI